MPKLIANKSELCKKIIGCWVGKNVGGPFEGQRDTLDVTGYTTPALIPTSAPRAS